MTAFYDADHEAFRATVRPWVASEVEPHLREWDEARRIPPELWASAASLGLLGLRCPENVGGGGVHDYRFRFVLVEELARVGASAVNVAISLLDDLVAPYLVDLGTEEQKSRWLPPLMRGEQTAAIAMTEPGAGSDLQGIRTRARRFDDGWILSGSKTFITNGVHADVVVVFALTGDETDRASERYSLFVVEEGMPGFSRGQPFDTMGQRSESISELLFDDVFVPDANLLGREGAGFLHLMERLPVERMSIAVYAVAAAEQALRWSLDYVRDREAFGKPLSELQNTRFVLAEVATEVDVARAYIESCVLRLNSGDLSAVDAAKAKWWASEMLIRVTTRCLQLFGGYGWMMEYPIAHLFVDSRVHTIYGGTTEIMKEIIGRDLVSGR